MGDTTVTPVSLINTCWLKRARILLQAVLYEDNDAVSRSDMGNSDKNKPSSRKQQDLSP